jgi:hypothetical protein
MPTTYRWKNYERGRWKQEDLERAENSIKGKTVGMNGASRHLEFMVLKKTNCS